MAWGKKKCGECGEEGRHLKGCSQADGGKRARQERQLADANARAEKEFSRKADEFIAKHPHGSPYYTPNPFPGVTCESRPDRNERYHYIRR